MISQSPKREYIEIKKLALGRTIEPAIRFQIRPESVDRFEPIGRPKMPESKEIAQLFRDERGNALEARSVRVPRPMAHDGPWLGSYKIF
jgi:hypothetical protein